MPAAATAPPFVSRNVLAEDAEAKGATNVEPVGPRAAKVDP